MSHRNAPLSFEGRLRLVQRCRRRPIAHVAAEMGISRACASKWVNRWRRFGELGLIDRSSTPRHSPNATPAEVIGQIESWRREQKWSAARIAHELAGLGFAIDRRTVSRHLDRLGLGLAFELGFEPAAAGLPESTNADNQETEPSRRVWLFLTYRDRAAREVRSELSLPDQMSGNRPDRFPIRIILGPEPIDPDVEIGDDKDIDDDGGIEVPVARR